MTPEERRSARIGSVTRAWWPDEVARAGSEHLEPEYVAVFDRKSATDWSETIRSLAELGIGAQSSIIDIGAGTGSFALAVQPHVRRLVAVDPSPAMVASMRGSGIEAVQAGLLTYEHDADPADLVHSRNALHHLPDFWKAVALDRVARMLTPGGVLMLTDIVYSFGPAEADTMIKRWVEHAPADPALGWTADELAEHVRTEHSTFSWLLEPILDRAGFDVADCRYSESQVHASYVCHRR
jgi:SAM-dependent methyltransferase